MRKLLFNLHLYSALIVGIFVVIIGVTGSIMAFEDDLDRLFNPALYRVEPKGEMMPVSAMLAAGSKAFPGQRIGNLRLPLNPQDSAGFAVRGPKQVFMNPYTGEILGSRSAVTVLAAIHQLHLRLLLGPAGGNIVAAVTVVLIFLVLSGIYLWWPRKRLTIKRGSLWRIAFDAHNAVGIYSALFLLVLGITGIVIHYDNDIETYLHKSAGTAKITKGAPSVDQPEATPITPDQAIQNAANALPGAKPIFISVPPNKKSSYLVALRYPEDLTPGGRSWANVDQYSGKVVNFQDSRTVATGTRAIIVNRAIHTGDIFGYVSKIVVSLSSLMLIAQAITGYYMWWKKSPKWPT